MSALEQLLCVYVCVWGGGGVVLVHCVSPLLHLRMFFLFLGSFITLALQKAKRYIVYPRVWCILLCLWGCVRARVCYLVPLVYGTVLLWFFFLCMAGHFSFFFCCPGRIWVYVITRDSPRSIPGMIHRIIIFIRVHHTIRIYTMQR